MSITRRLIITLTVGATLLWVFGAVIAALVLRNEVDRSLDGGLRETAERVLPLAIKALQNADSTQSQPAIADPGGDEDVVYQLRDKARIVMRSHDAPSVPFAAPLTEGFATAPPWRVYTAGDPLTGLYVQVAESEQRRSDGLQRSVAALLLPLLLLVPAAIFGVGVAVRRGLQPVRRLGDEVRRRDAANLRPLGPQEAPEELRPMTAAIDGLLQRLKAAFDAERALAANSAHELRTPIAGSLAQTQRLVDELGGHPAQARARTVEESLQRLSRLADKLLALSRAEAGISRLAEPVDLLPALRVVCDEAVARHDTAGRIKTSPVADARLAGRIDLDTFGIVLRNLVENALLHGTGDVVIAVPRDNVIEITNGGPITPPERLAYLTQRFARGETTAIGSGLGLAIVDTIMGQVGGKLELQSPGNGRSDGFTARLMF